jgi:hypothetical protein
VSIAVFALSSCTSDEEKTKTWLGCLDQANLQIKNNHYVKAEELYLQAEDLCEKSCGKEDPRVGTCLAYLAELYRGETEYIKAARTYRKLIALEEKAHGNPSDIERWREEYNQILRKMEKYGITDAESEQDQKNLNKAEESANKAKPEKPAATKEDQAKQDQSKPGAGKAEEGKQEGKEEEEKKDQSKPDQSKPSQSKADQAKSGQAKSATVEGKDAAEDQQNTSKESPADKNPAKDSK